MRGCSGKFLHLHSSSPGRRSSEVTSDNGTGVTNLGKTYGWEEEGKKRIVTLGFGLKVRHICS